jgi:transcriptional repressor NrdR
VIDSRRAREGFQIRRRRKCLDCERRFTTYEDVEESPLRVVKKDGRREPFDRRKVLNSMMVACRKRPISSQVLDDVVSRIEAGIAKRFDREVDSRYIGEAVMEELRELDKVAYVRFASVYREFADVSEFMTELRGMLGKEEGSASRK